MCLFRNNICCLVITILSPLWYYSLYAGENEDSKPPGPSHDISNQRLKQAAAPSVQVRLVVQTSSSPFGVQLPPSGDHVKLFLRRQSPNAPSNDLKFGFKVQFL